MGILFGLLVIASGLANGSQPGLSLLNGHQCIMLHRVQLIFRRVESSPVLIIGWRTRPQSIFLFKHMYARLNRPRVAVCPEAAEEVGALTSGCSSGSKGRSERPRPIGTVPCRKGPIRRSAG